MPLTAKEMLDQAIMDLESRLGLQPNQALTASGNDQKPSQPKSKKQSNPPNKKSSSGKATEEKKNTAAGDGDGEDNLPDICKLEFKVGQIVKVWNHPEADKLYCEEIEVGEEAPRQIASGLRPHFTLEQMQGQRLLVVSNLKPKNLVKFKSHGMVLCAAMPMEGGEGERVEFVEPPLEAKIGEVVTFEGLPSPQPLAPSQVEKKKVFALCMDGMKTTSDCLAAWNGHVFMTSAGPCRAKTIAEGVMR